MVLVNILYLCVILCTVFVSDKLYMNKSIILQIKQQFFAGLIKDVYVVVCRHLVFAAKCSHLGCCSTKSLKKHIY